MNDGAMIGIVGFPAGAALEQAPVPLLIHDVDGRILLANAQWRRLTGLALERTPTLATWLAFACPGSDEATAAIALLKDESLTEPRELRFRANDGAAMVWRIRSAPLGRNASGSRIIITAGLEAQTDAETPGARAEREARLGLATGAEAAGAFAWDVAERAGHYSREYLQMHGLSRDQGTEIFDVWFARVHPGDRERMLAYLDELGGPNPSSSIVYRIRRPSDGETRWISERRSILRDATGAATRVVGLQHDITHTHDIEAAALDAEQRLSLAVEAGHIGVFDWDLVGLRLTWNDHLRTIWALPANEIVTFETFYRGIHPDDLARVAAVIEAAHDPLGDGVYETEFRVIGATDSCERFVTVRGRTTFESGRAMRMTGVTVDVTALREAEAVVKRDHAELEQLVEARTRDLEEAQARLAQARRIEAIGQLAGGISHDFNNVLQAVEAGAELIEARSDPDSLCRYIRMIRQATKRGAAISRRLLAIVHRDELDAQPVEVRPWLESLKPLVERTLGSDIELVVETTPDLPLMHADTRQLETALINLVSNARDAMNRKGLFRISAVAQLAAEAAGPPFRPSLKPGRYIKLSLSDSGAGMSPDVLARATEPFFTTKPGGRSAGLGLAVARGFAEQSGGDLRIQSALQLGTTVAIWLPIAGAPRRVAAEPASIRRSREGDNAPVRARLLVLDDDALVRESLEEQLRAAGYAVTAASDGAKAVELMESGAAFDLVVSDFSMPGMDGVTFLRNARRLRPKLPAILLTGYATEAAKAAAGDFVLLRKPIERDVLLSRISIMLQQAVV